jgi:hypothetical protein
LPLELEITNPWLVLDFGYGAQILPFVHFKCHLELLAPGLGYSIIRVIEVPCKYFIIGSFVNSRVISRYK